MDIYTWSKPSKQQDSKPIKSTIQPGITMIIGSNGVGKTTYLQQIHSLFVDRSWEQISLNDNIRDIYGCYFYSNEHERITAADSWLNDLYKPDVPSLLASYYENSEGQKMMQMLQDKLSQIGSYVRKCKQENKKGVVILFDSLDSGLSPDNINILKEQLLNFIIEEERRVDELFEVYILCTANSYELCGGYRCYNIKENKYKDVSTYEQFVSNF